MQVAHLWLGQVRRGPRKCASRQLHHACMPESLTGESLDECPWCCFGISVSLYKRAAWTKRGQPIVYRPVARTCGHR